MGTKKKTKNMMDLAKENIGVGILTTAGTYGFSRVGAAHPTTTTTANTVVGGLQLAQVGQVAKTGMGLVNMFSEQTSTTKKTKRTAKKGSVDEKLKKMLG